MKYAHSVGCVTHLTTAALTQYNSQTHENEADALGLLIAGLACFDINKGGWVRTVYQPCIN